MTAPAIVETIRARIRRAVQDGQQEPAKISARIVPQLTDRECREALLIALPYLVRDELRKLRHDAIGNRGGERGDSGWRTDPGLHPPARPAAEEPMSQPEAARAAEHSRQRREMAARGGQATTDRRQRELKLLETPFHVNGEWKKLIDCTPDDLRVLARDYRARAAEHQARADGFARLADKLEEAGARTVREYRGELRPEFAEQ